MKRIILTTVSALALVGSAPAFAQANNSTVSQTGTNAMASVGQGGANSDSFVTQGGDHNLSTVNQSGIGNMAAAIEPSSGQ